MLVFKHMQTATFMSTEYRTLYIHGQLSKNINRTCNNYTNICTLCETTLIIINYTYGNGGKKLTYVESIHKNYVKNVTAFKIQNHINQHTI